MKIQLFNIILLLLLCGCSKEDEGNLKVFVYPNPTSGPVTVAVEIPGSYEISIENPDGKVFFTDVMNGTSREVDLSSLPNGTYHVKVKSWISHGMAKVEKIS